MRFVHYKTQDNISLLREVESGKWGIFLTDEKKKIIQAICCNTHEDMINDLKKINSGGFTQATTLNTLEYMLELRTSTRDPIPALLYHGDLDAIIEALQEAQQ